MNNTIFRLIEPRIIEKIPDSIEDTVEGVIVRPTHLSICHADQRYYQGLRAPEVLAKKLPMALIHEGIGKVVRDPSNEFAEGDTVVMIPNTPVEKDEIIAENYLRSSRFRASGFDGFMQDYVVLDKDRLVALPDDVDKEVASFTEIVSVSYHAVSRFDRFAHSRRNHIGVWGDGNLAFITALMLRYRFPDMKISIFGLVPEKMAEFAFADATYHVDEIPADLRVDHAFECVGGNGSPVAINQIIDYIHPEGTIAIMGVTEHPAPINTRMILEKGLRVFGTSRSGRQDFVDTVELYKEHPEFVNKLRTIVNDVVEINDIKDMISAFELDIEHPDGKTVLIWSR